MKSQIFGRKAGSGAEMTLLISGEGASSGGRPADTGRLHEFEVANARRAVKVLREKGVEGYVMFESDPARYEFTPDEDFVYPAVSH
ncbi:hypothetical protein [Pandoraea apista]|uniref:hypothetical protein n=1 Tax=Pandoraea apista TaxID=93218 RepID=UPI000658DA6E|nr:hypothetical protein [Pandoraea apista]ALS68370.1 hypothetical protein AT395_24805 [Pandoraea apista]ALS68432.1 hypothetical protein AT395_25155 [Pandoraea apista]CFB60460.1 hypothetical protein LMG16407_00499 [Pandoraea apista]